MIAMPLNLTGLRIRPGGKSRFCRRPVIEALEERLQLSTVTPSSVTLGPGSPLDLTRSQVVPLSITLPPTALSNKVDIALLLNDTGSFSGLVGTVESYFSNLVNSLQTALPGVDFGFGVARFKDFGGPFTSVSRDIAASRPFILDQPIVTAATAQAAGTTLNALISNALAAVSPGNGGDTPEADIEALYQIATGAGFDGNGNGSKLDSGPAGALTTVVNPGSSGDVPPFSSNVGLTSGSLGGIGWRPGAEHIVLLATDTAPVAAFSTSPIPSTITGIGGVPVPSTAFESSFGRVGFVSTALDGTGTGPQPGVVPQGAATVEETIYALNSRGIRVIGMGPDVVPTNNPGPMPFSGPFLSALARVTGAVDENTGQPLVLSTTVSDAELQSTIVSALTTVASQPVDIALLPVGLPQGMTFTPVPGVVNRLGPGGTGSFDVALTVNSIPFTGAFYAIFVDPASGMLLGTVPFQINLPSTTPPVTADPPTVLGGHRLTDHRHRTTILINFSEAMNSSSVQNMNNYILWGPRGRVMSLAAAAYDAVAHTVTLRPMRNLLSGRSYTLEIKGQGTTPVTSVAGVALDGMRTGHPGNNYYGTLRNNWLYPNVLRQNLRAGR
jgi:hypothetical protein